MTTSTSSAPPPIVVEPQPESRLDQLTAQYDLAKAEAKKAEDTLKAITDAIKLELSSAGALLQPGATDIRLDSPNLEKPLQLLYVERWTVDAKKLKSESPETYVRYAKKGGSWRLAQVAS